MIDFNLDPGAVITLLVAVVLPVLVGLVTKTVTSPGRKAITLAALALVTGLLSQLGAAVAAGVSYDLGAGLVNGLGAFIVAVALHYGLWKPVGVSQAAQEIGSSAHVSGEQVMTSSQYDQARYEAQRREHSGSGLGDAMNGTPEHRRDYEDVADRPIEP